MCVFALCVLFTCTDIGCEVLKESVIQQFCVVVQDKLKAWFGVALTNQFPKLLLVWLTA